MGELRAAAAATSRGEYERGETGEGGVGGGFGDGGKAG